mgnify:CR=1 FL=1
MSRVCSDGCVTHSSIFCFFQAEDGIRDLVRSRGLGDVYKRQVYKGGEEYFSSIRYSASGMWKPGEWHRVQFGWQLSLIHI